MLPNKSRNEQHKYNNGSHNQQDSYNTTNYTNGAASHRNMTARLGINYRKNRIKYTNRTAKTKKAFLAKLSRESIKEIWKYFIDKLSDDIEINMERSPQPKEKKKENGKKTSCQS